MFGKLFGRKPRAEASESEAARGGGPARAALLAEIERRRAAEPMLGPKLAGREVLERLLASMKDERGVHVESIVTALGALAGRACQEAMLAGVAGGDARYAGKSVVVVGGANGDDYVFGDAINLPLVDSEHSVWSLVAGMAQHLGAPLPDLAELFEHNASVVGGDAFGIPRFAPGTKAGDTPRNYAEALWPGLEPIHRDFTSGPGQWPAVYACALQQLFEMTGGRFDLTVLVRVAMDSAIATAKLKRG